MPQCKSPTLPPVRLVQFGNHDCQAPCSGPSGKAEGGGRRRLKEMVLAEGQPHI